MTGITFRVKWQKRKIMVIPFKPHGKQGPHFLVSLARDMVFFFPSGFQVLMLLLLQCNLQTELALEHRGLFSQFSNWIFMASPRAFAAYTCCSVPTGSKLGNKWGEKSCDTHLCYILLYKFHCITFLQTKIDYQGRGYILEESQCVFHRTPEVWHSKW